MTFDTIRFTISLWLLVSMTIVGQYAAAQQLIFDDFSDPDLSTGVEWLGDVADFTVTDERLQLNAQEAGFSQLQTAYEWSDSLRYAVDVDLLFGPSNDNKLRIYIRKGLSPISPTLYLEVGESGSDDAFILYRWTDTGSDELFRFASVPHTSSRFHVAIEVEHYADNNWIFRFDHGADGSVDDEQAVNVGYSSGGQGFFGFECSYTSSRRDRFFFDNVLVEKILADVTPPSINTVEAKNLNKIIVQFDEPIASASLSPDQFVLNPGNRQPSAVLWDELLPNQICLEFEPALMNDRQYTLTIDDIADVSGNVATSQSSDVYALVAEEVAVGDVIVNEIHAAPSSITALPNVEFIEIFNLSDKIIDIGNLQFSDAASTTSLSSVILRPDEYAIVCDMDDVGSFADIEHVVGADNFPSLNNSGDICKLSQGGTIIDQISYSQSWYDDENRTSGYSLERINPESACVGRINWAGSTDPTGGTPGEINSVYAPQEPDGIAELLTIDVVDERTLAVTFDLEMNAEQLMNAANYSIEPAISIMQVDLPSASVNEAVITLSSALEPGTIYTLFLSTNLCFCNGNKWPDEPQRMFGLPADPESGDVVVSEILYSPLSGEAEFVELANQSNKILRSTDMWLSYENVDGSFWARKIGVDFLLLPGHYYVLTDVRESVLEQYDAPNPDQVYTWDLPSLTNSGGQFNLFYFDENQDSISMDEAAYSPDWHDPLLDNDKGVSLERLVLSASGLNANNWYSAATLKGGATPTGENSQRLRPNQPNEGTFSMQSPTFSPDGDGFEDVMVLSYTFDEPGYIANVRMFSHDGVLVKTLTSNASVGVDGQFIWAGDTDDGSMARVGIYYAVISAYQVNGKTIESKEKIVLARQF